MALANHLYWIDFLDGFRDILIIFLFIVTVIIILGIFCNSDHKFWGAIIFLCIFDFFIGIAIAAIPQKDTMYMMLGSEYLNRTDIPKKVQLIVEKKLDDLLINDKDTSYESRKT